MNIDEQIIALFDQKIDALYDQAKTLLLEPENYDGSSSSPVEVSNIESYIDYLEASLSKSFLRFSALNIYVSDVDDELFTKQMYPLGMLKNEVTIQIQELYVKGNKLISALELAELDKS